MNALAYDSEIRRGGMDGGLFSETVMYGEKKRNDSRIAWTGMARYVEGAWTGH